MQIPGPSQDLCFTPPSVGGPRGPKLRRKWDRPTDGPCTQPPHGMCTLRPPEQGEKSVWQDSSGSPRGRKAFCLLEE